MTFLFNFLEIILMIFVSLDTLGFLAEFRKRNKSDSQDFLRICFTWVFFLFFRSISCSECNGIIGHFYGMLMLIAKIYVALPMLHGTKMLYELSIEKNLLNPYLKQICGNSKTKMEQKEEHIKGE